MKYFSLIYQGDIHPAPDVKAIPQAEFALLLSAQELLVKAQEDAERFLENNRKECAELQEKHAQLGFQEGLEKFADQLLHFDMTLKKIYHQLQNQVLSLAIQAAKKMVTKQLELHPETVVDIVMQAIAPLKQHRRFTIYVNKVDYPTLEKNKSQIKEILERLESLVFVVREDISSGGCIIESDAGIINATTENLWKAFESAFSKYTASPPQP